LQAGTDKQIRDGIRVDAGPDPAQLRTSDMPELAGLHTVNAGAIAYLALTLARQALGITRNGMAD
jgi:hypothetical protein